MEGAGGKVDEKEGSKVKEGGSPGQEEEEG